jgi:TusA-related sulfurtransferase
MQIDLEKVNMTTETIEVDIRGQVCPSCLLLTLREVNKHYAALVEGSARLVVLIDSRDATGTIPATVQNMGLASRVDKVEGYYRVSIERPGVQS